MGKPRLNGGWQVIVDGGCHSVWRTLREAQAEAKRLIRDEGEGLPGAPSVGVAQWWIADPRMIEVDSAQAEVGS